MVAAISPVETARDAFLADLTEAALTAATRHGSRGPSVDLEIDLWNALGAELREPALADRRPGERWENRLARLTEAAYGVVLRHGFADSFVELEMDLWRALRGAIRVRRFVPETLPVTPKLPRPTTSGRALPRLSSILDLRERPL